MKRLIVFMAIFALLFACLSQITIVKADDTPTICNTSETPVVLNAEPAMFSVAVPTSLPISVSTTGKVSVATNNRIVNNSAGPVRVENVDIVAANGWELVDYEIDKELFKVNEKKIGIQLNDLTEHTDSSGKYMFDSTKWDIMLKSDDEDGGKDEYVFTYDAILAPQSNAIVGATVADVIFTIGWDKVINIPVAAVDSEGNSINITSTIIEGEQKTELLTQLVESGLVAATNNVNALIDVATDDFENLATATFDVSDIAKEGDTISVFHFNETTQQWEHISDCVVDTDGNISADFSSFSPVAFVVTEKNETEPEEPSDPTLNHSGIIPEGGVYKKLDGWRLEYSGSASYFYWDDVIVLEKGEEFPSPEYGDVYYYGDYTYCFGFSPWCRRCGAMGIWQVECCGTDRFYLDPYDLHYGWSVMYRGTSAEPSAILETIASCPIVKLDYAFYKNANITTAPTVPGTVENMNYTFYECRSLTTAPTIPYGVLNMIETFVNCTSLTGTIEVNAELNDPERISEAALIGYFGCFYGIDLQRQQITLVGTSTLLDKLSATAVGYCSECNGLCRTPVSGEVFETEDYIYTYNYLLYGQKLDGWSVIVKDKQKTSYENVLEEIFHKPVVKISFSECVNLIEAPTIPNGVTDMSNVFKNCTSLTTVHTIQDTVKYMDNTFEGCTSLTTVPSIPSSVTSMKNTFKNCTSLIVAPTLPINVNYIDGIFEGCESLTTVTTIPRSVYRIDRAFYGCTSLTGTIAIHSWLDSDIINVENNYADCFYNVNFQTQKIILTGECEILDDFGNTGIDYCDECNGYCHTPNNGTVFEAGDYTYTYQTSLNGWSAVVKDKQKTSYGNILEEIRHTPVVKVSFFECAKLVESPTLPSCTTSLDYAFSGCKSLKKAPEIPIGVTTMDNTFKGCASLTEAPVIPSTVKNMNYAFSGCTSLTTAPSISNGVTNLFCAFSDCTSLTIAPTIPNSVTNIGHAFKGCTSLIEAPAIPSGITSMTYTFYGCSSLEKAPMIPSNVTDLSCTFEGCAALKTYVGAPEGTADGDFSEYVIPDGVVQMYQTFSGCALLKVAPNIPNKVSVMNRAFKDCSSLITVPEIPASVTDMYSIFQNCQSITGTITIHANPQGYSGCFDGIDFKSQKLTLTGSSTMLDEMGATGIHYCDNCNGVCNETPVDNEIYETKDYVYVYRERYDNSSGWVVSVKDKTKTSYEPILDNIKNRPIISLSSLFENCTNLISAPSIPYGVKHLDSTFKNCKLLTEAPKIPNSVTRMNSAFYNCTSLTEVSVIPDSVGSLYYTFYGCTSLTTAPVIPNGVTDTRYTFYGCTSLTTAPAIPSSATDVGHMFYGCTNLKTYAGSVDVDGDFSNYIIPRGVTSMRMTFDNCKSLISAPTIPDGVIDMYWTFSGCVSLATAPEIPGSVTNMECAFNNCPSLTGSIAINANPEIYNNCFAFIDFKTQKIKLVGKSNMLDDIGATGKNYCADCNGGLCDCIPLDGETYETEDYIYTYSTSIYDGSIYQFHKGWQVAVKDKTKNSYEDILEEIKKQPVASLASTFADCINLTESPSIPKNIRLMTNTFKGCTSLTKAPIIPDGVTNMSGAFGGCVALTEAPIMPEDVKAVGSVFGGCKNLKTYVGSTNPDGDFSGYVIPNVNSISGMFNGCTSLTITPVIPNTVKYIYQTFYGCKALRKVTNIPEGITDMGSAFDGCTSLTTVPAIPNTAVNMERAFYNCTSLTGIIEINAEPSSCSNCFKNVDFILQNLTLAGTSTMLDTIGATGKNYNTERYEYGDYVYIYNPTLNGWNVHVKDKTQTTYGTILDTVNDKPVVSMENTFSDCVNMTTAPAIPSTISNLRYTFANCTALTGTVEIDIEPYGYYCCFQNVDFIAQNLTLTGSSLYLDWIGSTGINYVIETHETEDYIYTHSSAIKGFYVEVKDKTKTIYEPILENINGKPVVSLDYTFEECVNLKESPVIPSAIQYLIGTFYGCTSLETAPMIPNSVIDMSETFASCTSLIVAPEIPDSVINMCGTFADCASLTAAPAIPNGVVDIGCAFIYCTSLTTAPVIPETVEYMYGTFMGCTALTGEIEINTNAEEYYDCFCEVDFKSQKLTLTGDSTILDEIGATGNNYCADHNGWCEDLIDGETYEYGDYIYTYSADNEGWSVAIKTYKETYGEILSTIKNKPVVDMSFTFAESSIVTSPVIPSTVKYTESIFNMCAALKNVTIADGVTNIGVCAFVNCHSLGNIDIPNSVTVIDEAAFGACISLKNIAIPNGVTKIAQYTFAECVALESVTIPNSITIIEESAFEGCVALKNITFNGTKEQWISIVQASSLPWNNGCSEITVTCTNGAVTISPAV